ncbi:hypothetical protein BKA81DRAFT_434960 [Phyllosticta paracitricarpa]
MSFSSSPSVSDDGEVELGALEAFLASQATASDQLQTLASRVRSLQLQVEPIVQMPPQTEDDHVYPYPVKLGLRGPQEILLRLHVADDAPDVDIEHVRLSDAVGDPIHVALPRDADKTRLIHTWKHILLQVAAALGEYGERKDEIMHGQHEEGQEEDAG